MSWLSKYAPLLIWLLLVIVVILLIIPPAWATDRNTPNTSSRSDSTSNAGSDASSNSGSTSTSSNSLSNSMVGGDNASSNSVTIEGGRALAISNVLGDVDIAACLGSVQFGTPIWSKQKLILNQVCMAEFYIKMQKFDLAAMSLCNVPEILAEFETEEDCEYAHDFEPVYEAAVIVEAYDEDEEEYHREIVEQNTELAERITQLEAVKPKVTRQIVQQPFLSDAKRAQLEELKQ